MADLRGRPRSTNVEDRRRAEDTIAALNEMMLRGGGNPSGIPFVAPSMAALSYGVDTVRALPWMIGSTFASPETLSGKVSAPGYAPPHIPLDRSPHRPRGEQGNYRRYLEWKKEHEGFKKLSKPSEEYTSESGKFQRPDREKGFVEGGRLTGSAGNDTLRGGDGGDPFTKEGESYVQDIIWNGYDANLKPEVIQVLNAAQQLLDFPIVLRSGYRDRNRNRRVGGAKASQHLTGNAVDISLNSLDDRQRERLATALYQSGGKRLGIYKGNTGLHLDMSPQKPGKGSGYEDAPFYPMYDRSINNMESSPKWFRDLAQGKGTPIPPANIPGPAPATPSSALALQRATPSVDTLGVPPTGSAADAAAALAGDVPLPRARPPGAPVAVDPNAPQPMPRPRDRMPGARPGLGMTDTQVADVYKGTPVRPPTVADVYKGTPLPPAAVPQAEIIPAAYPVPGATTPTGVDPVVDPLSRQRNFAFLEQAREAGANAAPPPAPTGSMVVKDAGARDVAPTPATMSPALKAARARLATERARLAGTRVGEGAVAESPATELYMPGRPPHKNTFSLDPAVAETISGFAGNDTLTDGMTVQKPTPVAPKKLGNVLAPPVPAMQSDVLRQKRNALAPNPAVMSFSLDDIRNGRKPGSYALPSIGDTIAAQPGNSLMGRMVGRRNVRALAKDYERGLERAQNALSWMRPGANLITIYGSSQVPGNTLRPAQVNPSVTAPNGSVQYYDRDEGLTEIQQMLHAHAR